MSSAGTDLPPGPVSTTGRLRRRAPRSRHRRPRELTVGAVLGRLVLLVAVLAAGGAVANERLSTEERLQEFTVTAPVGEPAATLELEVTVRGVRTAGAITNQPGWRHSTAGIWVLAWVRVEAQQEPTSIGYAAVRDSSGREWQPTGRIAQPLLGTYEFQPGIPVEAEIAFEVPPEAATDLTLRLTETSPLFHLSLATVAEVALPVTPSMVSQAVADAARETDDALDEAAKPEPAAIDPPRVELADPPEPANPGRWLSGE